MWARVRDAVLISGKARRDQRWRAPAKNFFRRCAGPTLLLVGSEDPIVPVSVMREVSELVRGSEVILVPEAGHSACFEKPEAFNRHVLDFIERRAVY